MIGWVLLIVLNWVGCLRCLLGFVGGLWVFGLGGLGLLLFGGGGVGFSLLFKWLKLLL